MEKKLHSYPLVVSKVMSTGDEAKSETSTFQKSPFNFDTSMVLSPLFIQYTFPATRSKSMPVGSVTPERMISWFLPSIVARLTILSVESVQYTRSSNGSKAMPVGLSIFENGRGTRMLSENCEMYSSL